MARQTIATPERILDAALARFSSYGFRRTSMEDIAAEAGLSRAALYLQFRNKDEIFRSLSQVLHEEALGRAVKALGEKGPLVERLRAAFEGMSLRLVGIVYGSPHGGELLDERNRLSGDLAAQTGRRFQNALTAAFRRAAREGEVDLAARRMTPAEAAELLRQAVSGLKGPGLTVETYRTRLAALVRVFVAGLGGEVGGGKIRSRRASSRRR
jgi:AcrR family transcriptional regulator